MRLESQDLQQASPRELHTHGKALQDSAVVLALAGAEDDRMPARRLARRDPDLFQIAADGIGVPVVIGLEHKVRDPAMVGRWLRTAPPAEHLQGMGRPMTEDHAECAGSGEPVIW